MLVSPGTEAVQLTLPVDLPLGTGVEASRQATSVPLPDEALLLLYTDGLVERRDEPIVNGLERLRRSIHHGPAEAVCQDVMATVAPERHTDDIALLAVSKLPTARP
jgi:serine phosphatase RsbU (regulator of sigma subunit)